MLSFVVFVAWLASSIILFFVLFFFAEVFLFSKPPINMASSRAKEIKGFSARAAIIIPAHNEEAVIEDCLKSIIPQLKKQDEIIVVADNCNDNTKELAESFPVTVVERWDKARRGKGFALDFGMSCIQPQDFDVVIMIDADCVMGDGCRDNLVAKCLERNRPVQCQYLMIPNSHNPPLSLRFSEFSWRVKNIVRPNGLKKLGGPCQLMGSGMAFPPDLLDSVLLASDCIVEDLKLGLDLALEGYPPVFLPGAYVSSFFPDDELVGGGQKKRWIHGHLEMIFKYAPKLISSSFLKKDYQLMLLCFDLVLPPLILFLLLVLAVGIFSTLLGFIVGSPLYIIVLVSISLLFMALYLAWAKVGSDILSLKQLVVGVFIRSNSFSVYLSFFTDRVKSWNKTSRK